jgi:hypothetical protein
MHDDLYLELAKQHWQDLQREVERDRAVRLARSGLPPRRPWVWSLLGEPSLSRGRLSQHIRDGGAE